MPTLRRGSRDSRIAAEPGRPEILLESESPYASRRVVVEYDGATTAAYLHDRISAIAATWIANHGQAPATADPARLNSGQAPVMPAAHTKHPDGRPVPEPVRAARALAGGRRRRRRSWRTASSSPCCPGWSDMSSGCPATAATSSARPRSAGRSTTRWRAWARGRSRRPGSGAGGPTSDAWARFQQAVLGHLLARLGPGGQVLGRRRRQGSRWSACPSGRRPATGTSPCCPPSGCAASGCRSSSRSPRTSARRPRIELAIATTLPSTEAARIFLWLAQYPWRDVTWFGPGHTLRWYHEPADVPARRRQLGRAAAGRARRPARARGPGPVRLHVRRRPGAVAVGRPDQRAASACWRGSAASASLVTQLAAQRRSWVVGHS